MNRLEDIPLNTFNDEDEIDIKEIFSILSQYKKSIIFITILTTLSAFVYAYFAPNIYQSQSMIKLNPNDYYGNRNDFMSVAMGKEGNNILDELVVFKTRHLAEGALKHLNIGTRYFVTKHLKTHELYKNSPFVVTSESINPRLQGVKFTLLPLEKNLFQLILEPSLKTKITNSLFGNEPEDEKPITYNKTHQYGEKIVTQWFSFTVQKLYEPDDLEYAFSVMDNKYMAGFMQGGISASSNEEMGNIVILNFTDTVPLRAKEILEAVSNTYIQENLDVKAESAKKKLHFIDMQVKAIHKTLEGSSKKLQDYKATNTIVSLDSNAQLTSTKLSQLESQLYEINLQIDMLDNTIQYMDTHEDIQGINIDSLQHTNASINRIILEIHSMLKQRAKASVYHTKSHPLMLKIMKELNSLTTSLRESILGSLRTLREQKKSLETLINKHKEKLQHLPEQEQQLEQLNRNFLFNEKIYSFLLNKRAETAIIEASTVSSIRIIEDASMPSAPIKPKRSITILVGLILGLILGISLAFLRNFLNNTIKTVEDIEKLTHIPIYSVLPHLDPKKSLNHYKEAINVLWSNIEFSQIKSKSKLITITSSVSTEGKTLTIAQLGNIIAQNNKSVIILDLDMRKATLHEHFKLHNHIGMSTLLTKRATLEEAIQETDNPHLKVITSGPKPPNPTGLIMSDLLEKITEKLM
ncbi:MAG: hypothetical protein FAF03_04515 [Epsilonproteobacteria bacterium]|nr:hypothetical protein [Campylobacterota bacterium]